MKSKMQITWSLLVGLLAFGRSQETKTEDYELGLENGILTSVTTLHDTDHLDLSHLGIIRIENHAFENVSVKILNLQSNNIDMLDSDVFSGLGADLEELNLGSNQIYHIESPFVGFENLKLLNLSDNPLGYLDGGVLAGVPKTANILLKNNVIKGFDTNLFERIDFDETDSARSRRRRATENQTLKELAIEEKSELGDVRNDTKPTVIIKDFVLEEVAFSKQDTSNSSNTRFPDSIWGVLRLMNFQIQSVAKGWFQLPKTQFSTIYFSGNNLTDILPELLNDLPESVKRVDLTDNLISEIKNDILSNDYIEKLDFVGNLIETIEDRAFESLNSLRLLTLSNNKIKDIAFAPSLSASLEELYLNENQILEIADGAFSKLENLTELFMKNNKISTIQSKAFEGLISLDFLDLSGNEIAKIESHSFVGIPKKYLGLNDNKISQFPSDSFNITSLRDLYLDNNLITDITEDTFQGLPGLEFLWLEGNQLSEIPPRSMKHLYALNILDISNNPFSKLQNGAFFGLPKTPEICEVFLDGNKIETIQGGIFDDL